VGSEYTIADIASYPWIVSWKVQQQNLDDFQNIKRWFEAIRNRPDTVSAYARAQPYSNQSAMTEESKKILFGQTAATVRAHIYPNDAT
jgi:GST-like protein